MFGGIAIECHAAAEEKIRIEPAENDIGVGYRRQFPAVGITHRPRVGTGALRANLEHAAGIDPSDTATARTDLNEVEGWHAEQPFAGLKARNDARLVAFDESSFGCGTTHVEGNHLFVLREAADMGGGEYSRGRTRFDNLHGNFSHHAGSQAAAGGLHNVKAAAKTAFSESTL